MVSTVPERLRRHRLKVSEYLRMGMDLGFAAISIKLRWEIFHRAPQGVRRGLPQAADGGILHGPCQFLEQRLIPSGLSHKLYGLCRSHAAGRALATRFIFKETHGIERGLPGAVVLG